MSVGSIAMGGALGALLRVYISHWLIKVTSVGFPWGTFGVNMLGCLLIGACWAHFQDVARSELWVLFIMMGFLGAFTTFSTFGLEMLRLWQTQQVLVAILYLLSSNILGLMAVGLGYWARQLF
ncbi:MAG: fluoride efflux transporter CrcB [Actinobacteria bacterium]|nr:fluoride efflux transporter CrcB [Actinomycetota bacterium]